MDKVLLVQPYSNTDPTKAWKYFFFILSETKFPYDDLPVNRFP